MTSDSRIAAPQTKPPLWRNATFLKWAAQIGVLAGVVAVGWILVSQAATNLQAQGRTFAWDFLTDPPGIQLGEGVFTLPETGLQALATGIVNMLRVTASGVLAATLIGVLAGVARLSSNWLLSKIASVYVETVRNVPLLVQIFFWFIVASRFFPDLPDTGEGTRLLIFSKKGISIPWFFPTATFWQWAVLLALGLVGSVWVYRRRVRLLEETGSDTHPGRWAFLVFFAAAVVGWFAHPLAGALGWLWSLVAAVIAAIPTLVWQLFFAAVAVWLGVRWILRFLESRRSPAGLARLTDDDWFRMGLAGALGLAGAAFLLLVPAFSEVVTDVGEFVFRFFDQKFDFLRTGAPLAFGLPEVVVPGRFPQIGPGGMTMTPAFFGVWMGVTLYTGAFIAEIVRGGILAVPRGQSEAGLALGLRRGQLLRMIILPQAFRIILPPMGNQYLNLAKNTSLGIAVGFAEIVQSGQTILNQTGAAIQVVLIWMGFYLTVSLVLSSIVNWYNRRLALVER